MSYIKKIITTKPNIGDEVKAPNTIFRPDIVLYICHIDGELLYISTEKNTPKDECETSFIEDCYLV